MTRHKRISLWKSALRLVGSGLASVLVVSDFSVALATFLLFFSLAELLGIIEEGDQ